MKDIAHIRKDYTKTSLDVKSVSKDPIQQFDHWFKEAVTAEVPEPNHQGRGRSVVCRWSGVRF